MEILGIALIVIFVFVLVAFFLFNIEKMKYAKSISLFGLTLEIADKYFEENEKRKPRKAGRVLGRTVSKSGLIRIVSPRPGEYVDRRPLVEGTAKASGVTIWTVVRSKTTGDYWVQPKARTKAGGDWGSLIFVGRPGNKDVGRRYEIMAVGNPAVGLKEGDVLDTWPEAEYISQMIEVVRR
ncbi:MAG: hypothetical protein PHT32_04245 [Candidatus Omnitrophica bacterium]|nr:hypothetical protein [Candidatus Omnitrophota bacterium]